MNCQKLLTIVSLSSFAFSSYGSESKLNTKPNIIIILTDDQGYQDLSCYGSPDIKTPNIDKLAHDGIKFTDFYVASSVCSPSRAALLTGCYPNKIGVTDVFFPNRGHYGLDPKYTTIAEMLKDVGYATKAVGKWHLGDNKEFLPTNQGFDSYYGIPYSNDMFPAKNMTYSTDCIFRENVDKEKLNTAFIKGEEVHKRGWNRNQPVGMRDRVPLMQDEECIEFPADQTTVTGRFTTKSIDFIRDSVQNKKHFFLYLAYSMPHVPLFVSKGFEGKSKRGLYGDAVEEIDYNVGRIINTLNKLDISKNTIVIYCSDNGPWLIKGAEAGSALPLFEGKTTQFEGGQRVPGIIKWPAKIKPGRVCSELVTTMDIFPTLASSVGGSLPKNVQLDGKDITNILIGKDGAKSEHEFFFYGTTAVRSGNWKYHAKEIYKVKKTKRPVTGPTLYNLKNDIGETTNVIDKYPEIAYRLKRALENSPNNIIKK